MANFDTCSTPSHAAPVAATNYEQRRRAEDGDNDDLEWGTEPMGEVFLALGSSPRGLTSADAAARLAAMGAGQARTWKQSRILKLLPLAVEAAAAVAMAVGLASGGGHGDVDARIGASFAALIAADFITGFAERSSAEGDAASALLARLTPPSQRAWVRRDGVWSEQDAAALVPGDVIRVGPRDAVPADALLLVDTGYSPQAIRIDQSALTGDPAPAAKFAGDGVYAGSACAHGEAEAVVIVSTAAGGGLQTHLQQAALLADATMGIREVVIYGAIWNACVVFVCFNCLVDAVAGNVSQYASAYIPGIVAMACFFAGTGWTLCQPVDQRRRRPERDPEELMRRLEVLWQNGSISEETLRRCRDLFGVEPVSEELVATLADHFGWQAMRHEDLGDGRAA